MTEQPEHRESIPHNDSTSSNSPSTPMDTVEETKAEEAKGIAPLTRAGSPVSRPLSDGSEAHPLFTHSELGKGWARLALTVRLEEGYSVGSASLRVTDVLDQEHSSLIRP